MLPIRWEIPGIVTKSIASVLSVSEEISMNCQSGL